MSNNKEKFNNIKSEENKIVMYKAELDLTLHNKLLQNRYICSKCPETRIN